jgi:hypothetical protein
VVIWLVVLRPRTGLAYVFFERLHLAGAKDGVRVPIAA